MIRVTAYIDGFNLYFGLRSKKWRKYYWLDLIKLVQSLLKPGQELVKTRYFTTRIRCTGNNVDDIKRQNNYIEALETMSDLSLHFGHYLEKKKQCRKCQAEWIYYEEKMTDVNIAVQLLTDAYEDRFDTALLISADSDLTVPVQQITNRFPGKRVIVCQPPGRNSSQLCKAASASLTISETKLRQSQLPATVKKPDGYLLQRPSYWR